MSMATRGKTVDLLVRDEGSIVLVTSTMHEARRWIDNPLG
jgi:hypothetical protein